MRTKLRRRIGVFVADATSGIPLVGGLLVCAIAVAVGVSATHRVLTPGWGDALNLCLYSCLYLAPAATGLAATHLGHMQRSGAFALADTAPAGRWRASQLGAFSILCWTWGAFTMLVIVALLGVNLNGPGSFNMVLIPVQGFLLIFVSTLSGAVVGRRLPAPWIAPVLTLSVFAVLYVLDVTAGPLDRWSPTYSGLAYRVNTVPNTLLFVSVSSILLAFAGALLAVLGRTSPNLRNISLFAALAAVTTVGVAHSQAAPGDVQFREGGPTKCRTDGPVTLCVFSDSAPQLAAMTGALVKATQAAAPLFEVPLRFYQPNVDVPAGGAPVDIPPIAERGGQLVRAVGALVPNCSTDPQDNIEIAGLIFEHIRPGITGPGEIADVALEPLADQRAWVASRLDRLRSCQ